jgi:hypothetical protein
MLTDPPGETGDPPVPGRSCGSCTLCCKLLRVDALHKPHDVWCKHCDPGRGCLIYDERPEECGKFYCGFMTGPHLDEAWRPSRCKIVLSAELRGQRLVAVVDRDRPEAWKAEPYYAALKQWAAVAATKGREVFVRIGTHNIVILPDRDVDLGIVGPDDVIVTQEIAGPHGTIRNPVKLKRDDPRLGPAKPR